jgi:hypothetical protein
MHMNGILGLGLISKTSKEKVLSNVETCTK